MAYSASKGQIVEMREDNIGVYHGQQGDSEYKPLVTTLVQVLFVFNK